MADETSDDHDEELATLSPRTPARRSPVTALVVIGLAVVVGWRLRHDIVFGLRGRTPVVLGEARTIDPAALRDNTYVTASGLPDRRNALFIEPRGEEVRQGFFRLLGTGSRLFVRAADTSQATALADRWTGRLRRLDALPWASQLRDYFANEVRARRYLVPEALKEAIGAKGEVTVKDRAGQPLALRPDTVVGIEVRDEARVEVMLSRDKYADESDALKEVERLGLQAELGYGTADDFGVIVDAPLAQRNAVLAKLEGRDLAFRLLMVRYLVPLERLSAGDAGLVVAAAEVEQPDGNKVPARRLPLTVPWDQVQAASVAEPVIIAPDAWVLTEGEAPGAFWWAPVLLVVLTAFAAFNGWVLARRRPRAAASA